MTQKHPIQPLAKDAHGVLRFKSNALVLRLLANSTSCGFGLNELATGDFTAEDWRQLSQLLGYSLSGYADLSYVDDTTYETAAAMADQGLSETEARIAYLERELAALREAMRSPCARLFGVHEDDLRGRA